MCLVYYLKVGSFQIKFIFTDLNKFPEKYVAKEVEKEWYDWWESNGLFGKSEARKNSKTFSLILPPPNVTGKISLIFKYYLLNSLRSS